MKGVWFRLDVGRQNNADPKWLVPVICRKGMITKREIGAIRVFEDETRFEIDEHAAERFAEAVRHAPYGDVRIEPSSSPGDKATAAPTPRKPQRKKFGKGEWKARPVLAPAPATKSEGKPGHAGKPKSDGQKKFAGKHKKGSDHKARVQA